MGVRRLTFDIWAFLDGLLCGWIISYYINKRINPEFRCFIFCKTCNMKTYISTSMKSYVTWIHDENQKYRYITCLDKHSNKYFPMDIDVE